MKHYELESATGFLKKTFNFSKHLKVHSEIEAGYAHAFFVGISTRFYLDAASNKSEMEQIADHLTLIKQDFLESELFSELTLDLRNQIANCEEQIKLLNEKNEDLQKEINRLTPYLNYFELAHRLEHGDGK